MLRQKRSRRARPRAAMPLLDRKRRERLDSPPWQNQPGWDAHNIATSPPSSLQSHAIHHLGVFMRTLALLCLVTFALAASAQMPASGTPNLDQLKKMSARFAPTQMRVDIRRLSSADQKALAKLVEAARVLNTIYMNQLWSGDVALYEKLKADKTLLGQARLHYFWVNKGPGSDLDEFHAFMPGVPGRKPEGANFYPAEMSKQDFESWVATLPPEQQEQAKGFFTVIRRVGGKLTIVPYSQEYRTDLEKCAALLREAAELTDNSTLK